MTEERCELTDLPDYMCGCARHRGPRETRDIGQEMYGPGPWFPSRYDGGTCSRCHFGFDKGTKIRADGRGGWECCED